MLLSLFVGVVLFGFFYQVFLFLPFLPHTPTRFVRIRGLAGWSFMDVYLDNFFSLWFLGGIVNTHLIQYSIL